MVGLSGGAPRTSKKCTKRNNNTLQRVRSRQSETAVDEGSYIYNQSINQVLFQTENVHST